MVKKTTSGLIDIESLARAHSARLLNFIRKHLHDIEAVDDVFQQTYLAAIESLGRFRGTAQPQTWLFGIAFNLVREHNRRQFRGGTSLPIEHYQSTLTDPYPCPETRLHHHRYIDSLMWEYERLPEHMQKVLELTSVDNKDYDSCANALNVPIGTVRSRLSRARTLLKNQVEQTSLAM